MQNSVEIFSIALGLVEPWYVKEVVFDKERLQLDVYLGFKKGHLFLADDTQYYTAYDTVERRWEHLNFFQHKCYLHAKVPRVMQSDGKIKTQEVPWARKGSGFTLLFEAFSMLLIENEMPVNKVAKLLQVYPARIWNVFDYWISIAHKEDVIDSLTKIGFDETSVKKGHNYITHTPWECRMPLYLYYLPVNFLSPYFPSISPEFSLISAISIQFLIYFNASSRSFCFISL